MLGELGPDPWPVDSLEALIALLGPDITVALGGRALPLSEAGPLIPAYYFPVVSAADLDSKLADLGLEPSDHDLAVTPLGVASACEDAGGWS